MKTVGLVFILFLCLGFISCKKQAPQLPSNKNLVADSSSVSLLTINQDLAHKEDSLLEKRVISSGKAFKKSEIGFWYKIDQSGNGSKIKGKTSCSLSYRLILLNGKLIENKTTTIKFGKKQSTVGLEEGIKLLQQGDSATFIIPWYLGYGMTGNETTIPPYTSLVYHVRIQNNPVSE
jgi:FKBP-type peptidyl-prolyl cis-trans isomerase